MNKLVFKTCLLKGEAGNNIESIEKTATSGLTDTYTITLTDGTTSTFEVTNGSTVDHIDRTGIYETYDEYTMYMTDGTSATFEVPHGPNGTFENFAVVEPNNTASRAYVKGQFLVYNGRLCVVTAAIAAGNTLAIGTNIAQTDVGTQLTTLDNRNIMYSSTEDNVQVRKNGAWQKPHIKKSLYYAAQQSGELTNFTLGTLINSGYDFFCFTGLYHGTDGSTALVIPVQSPLVNIDTLASFETLGINYPFMIECFPFDKRSAGIHFSISAASGAIHTALSFNTYDGAGTSATFSLRGILYEFNIWGV